MATRSKKSRLIEKAKASVRTPKPGRLGADAKKKTYRVVAISLYVPEAEWLDEATKMLQLGGNSKANRSLVVREAILRLQEDLEGKTPQETLHSFAEHEARRKAPPQTY
jgi:hypothetical protein